MRRFGVVDGCDHRKGPVNQILDRLGFDMGNHTRTPGHRR